MRHSLAAGMVVAANVLRMPEPVEDNDRLVEEAGVGRSRRTGPEEALAAAHHNGPDGAVVLHSVLAAMVAVGRIRHIVLAAVVAVDRNRRIVPAAAVVGHIRIDPAADHQEPVGRTLVDSYCTTWEEVERAGKMNCRKRGLVPRF